MLGNLFIFGKRSSSGIFNFNNTALFFALVDGFGGKCRRVAPRYNLFRAGNAQEKKKKSWISKRKRRNDK